MRDPFLSTLFVLLLLSPAGADECMDAASSQLEVNACAKQSYEAADARLHEVTNEIRQRLAEDAEAADLFGRTEMAWIAFRDAECAFAASAVAGGSVHPAIYSQCLADLTQERAAGLQRYLSCEEGDLSCPVLSAE